jgi:hypothetical protein
MTSHRVLEFYITAMALILAIDVSSNFLFPHITIYSSLLRDGLAFGMACILFLNSKFRLQHFLSFFFIILISGLLLGPTYVFYFLRVVIFLLLSLEITRRKQKLNVLLLIPLFLLLAFFIFPNTAIDQGYRFFIGNASVVGLLLVCLHKILPERQKKLITALGVLLTGSLAAIASIFLVNLSRLRFFSLLVAFIIVLPVVLPEGEAARRLNGLAGVFYGNFDGLGSVVTFSARAQQFMMAISSPDFSIIYGLPSNFFVSAAGIESQLLHVFAYGGVLGVVFFFAFFAVLALSAKVRMPISLLCVLLIYSFVYRWMESAVSVFFLTLLFSTNSDGVAFSISRRDKTLDVNEKKST